MCWFQVVGQQTDRLFVNFLARLAFAVFAVTVETELIFLPKTTVIKPYIGMAIMTGREP